jgi:hypothetical protein
MPVISELVPASVPKLSLTAMMFCRLTTIWFGLQIFISLEVALVIQSGPVLVSESPAPISTPSPRDPKRSGPLSSRLWPAVGGKLCDREFFYVKVTCHRAATVN